MHIRSARFESVQREYGNQVTLIGNNRNRYSKRLLYIVSTGNLVALSILYPILDTTSPSLTTSFMLTWTFAIGASTLKIGESVIGNIGRALGLLFTYLMSLSLASLLITKFADEDIRWILLLVAYLSILVTSFVVEILYLYSLRSQVNYADFDLFELEGMK